MPLFSEAEYVKLLHRDFIPVLVEERYQPDGWLGVMIGNKSICDLTTDNSMLQNMPLLIQALSEQSQPQQISYNDANSKIPATQHQPYRKISSISRSRTMEPTRSVGNWSRDDVQGWLEKLGLQELRSDFSHFDGLTLIGLQKMLLKAPAIYYYSMKHDFKIADLITLLRFTNALEMLA